jgi:ABC-type sugar transport system substrate-binding protein
MVAMGLGQVVTLRLPAAKLDQVNVELERRAWGVFETDFYPAYDFEVPIILREADEEMKQPSVDPLTWVAVDEYGMGHVGATWMAEQYCAEGRDRVEVVPFWGPAASEISQDRIGGALDALEEVLEACGVEWEVVIDDIFADFDRELAFNLTETVITSQPDVDLLIGANSNTALGIMEALAAQGRLEDIDVMGNGGQLDELAAICRGDIAAAGFRDAFEMGRNMARAVILDWEGQGDEVPEVTLSDLPVTHDCDTVFEFVPMEMLDTDGFRSNIPDGLWEEYVD